MPVYEIKFGCNLWKHGQTTNTSKPSFSISNGLLSIRAAQLTSINNKSFDNLIYSLLLFNIFWIVLNMFQSVWFNSLLGCCPPTMKCGHYVVPICDTLIAASQITASTEASKHLQREFQGVPCSTLWHSTIMLCESHAAGVLVETNCFDNQVDRHTQVPTRTSTTTVRQSHSWSMSSYVFLVHIQTLTQTSASAGSQRPTPKRAT